MLLARQAVLDNRELEARDDVITYSTPPLAETVEAVGPVRVELWVRASSEYFDMFARVCDVDADGASWNVCDALASVAPGRFERDAGGAWRVAFDLWPIGHRFAPGHRIRLQVSSGAHPRYARNPGTGEDPAIATELRPVEIEVLSGGVHPSALILPRPGGAAADRRRGPPGWPGARRAGLTSSPGLRVRARSRARDATRRHVAALAGADEGDPDPRLAGAARCGRRDGRSRRDRRADRS